MGTTKPRITVTLTEHQHQVLKTISEAGGQPMSGLVTELLEMCMPTLERMAVAFQRMRQVQQEQRSKIAEALDEAQRVLDPIAMQIAGQFDLIMGKIEDSVQASPAPAPDARKGAGAGVGDVRAAAPRPPSTNRGVTPTGEKGPKPKRGKASVAVRGAKVSSKKVR